MDTEKQLIVFLCFFVVLEKSVAVWYRSFMTNVEKTTLLQRYSRGEMTAGELRWRLGDISYADVIIELAQRDIPLPRAPQKGREEKIARAYAWLFPKVA